MTARPTWPPAWPRRRWPPSAETTWAVIAGLMATTAQPPFAGTGWLAVPALGLLFGLLAASSRPGRVAWSFGLAHQASLLHWLFLLGPDATITVKGLAPLSAALAILYCAAFYALGGWAFGRARRHLGATAAVLLLPVLWTAMEAARGVGEMGFPWCLTGAAWIRTPLLPLAAASGEIGLGAATAAAALALLAAVDGRRREPLLPGAGLRWRWAAAGLAVGLWAALAAGAAWRAAPAAPGAGTGAATAASAAAAIAGGAGGVVAPAAADAVPERSPLRVAAIQANVSLADKWDDAKIDSTTIPYDRLSRQAAAAGAELAVWAETAVPNYLIFEEELLSWVRKLALETKLFLFVGYPHARLMPGAREPLRFNGAGLFGPDGRLHDFYAKAHLLPFGERMPFQSLLPFLGKLDVGQAEWSEGAPPAPIVVATSRGEYRFAPLICFESIFPGLARQAVRRGSEMLVNITNDGWFGRTAGPRQHAELARLRAAECGVPLVRCANNGISFVVDERGRLLAWAGLQQRAVVLADVAPGRGGTPFVRFGAWPLAAILLLWTVGALVLARPRRRG